MIARVFNSLEWGLQRWTAAAARGGRRVVAALVLAALLALLYAVSVLTFDTSAANMIDARLPYRQTELAFRRAFPNLSETLLIKVSAATDADADQITERIADILQADPLFETVFAPDIHPFFVRNGLLYLSPQDLDSALSVMTRAGPLLRQIGTDPNVDDVLGLLAQVEEQVQVQVSAQTQVTEGAGTAAPSLAGQGNIQLLDRLYRAIARSADDLRKGMSPRRTDWSRLVTTGARGDAAVAQEGAPVIRLLTVTPVFDYSALQPARVVVDRVRAALIAAQDSTGIRADIGVTGTQALRSEELKSVTKGVGVAFLVSLICVALLLYTALKSWRMTGIAVGVLLISLCFSLAFAAAAIGTLNLVSVAFAVLLIGLGIDFVIHLAADILHQLAGGAARETALRRSVHAVGPALSIAAITSALAFLSFAPTDFVGMAQMGIIAAVGVIAAFLVTLTLLPACLGALPQHPASAQSHKVGTGQQPTPANIGGRRAVVVLRLVVLGLAIAAMPLAAKLDFNADPMALRDPNSPSVQVFQSLTGTPATTPYRLNAVTATLEEATQLARAARAHPLIAQATTLSDFIPEDQDNKLDIIDLAAEGILNDLTPSRRAEATMPAAANSAQGRRRLIAALENSDPTPGTGAAILYAALNTKDMNDDLWASDALRDALLGDWPRFLERTKARLMPDLIDYDGLPDAIVQRYRSQDGTYRVEFVPAEDVTDTRKRRAFLDAVKSYTENPAGPLRVYFESAKVIARAVIEATTGAFTFISLLLYLLLGRIRLVLAVMGPLALAASLAAAAAVALGLSLNFANVIALPLLIGLGVDSGVHLALRRRTDTDGRGLFATPTPKAVLYSALTTVTAFASLALSAHKGTASMGILLAIAVTAIVITSLTLTPVWALSRATMPDHSGSNGDETV